MSEQLAKGCYLTAASPIFKPTESQVELPNDCTHKVEVKLDSKRHFGY